MYEYHPSFIVPDDENVKIWRYFDIPKFLWLIEKRSLYFSRCDLLGDPFEGSLPSAPDQITFEPLFKKITAERLKLDENDIELEPSPSIVDNWRKCCYICSFHMNDHESAALWSMYTKAKQGIAIQSTFKKLVDSLKNYDINPVFIGSVKYIDRRVETIDVMQNMFLPILHKVKSFEYEREIRAVIHNPREVYSLPKTGSVAPSPIEVCEKCGGINVPIDLDCLIEHAYLAPTTKPWIKELLTSLMAKQGVRIQLEQSSLDDSPIF